MRNFRALTAAVALLLSPICAEAQTAGAEFTDYCLTIALRGERGERITRIYLVLENTTVVGIPRFPAEWEITIRNDIGSVPALISGVALRRLAGLVPSQLKCLFRVENSFIDRTIKMTGAGAVTLGMTQKRRILLHRDQVLFEEVGAK